MNAACQKTQFAIACHESQLLNGQLGQLDPSSMMNSIDDALTDSSTTAEGKDRRKSVRRCTLLPAFIVSEDLPTLINCTVRNISDGGARIRLERRLALPEYFQLRITDKGPLRKVRKCWHINDETGIEFCDGLI